MKITEAQTKCLLWLYDRGGSAFLDAYGRLVASGETFRQGSEIAWLNLIAKGLIQGGGHRLRASDEGEIAAADVKRAALVKLNKTRVANGTV